MSKFDYKAEGVLNSQYLLDLLNDYLDKVLKANNTNGIEEDEFKINAKANRFVQWFNHKTQLIKFKLGNGDKRENYNHILAVQYAKEIKDKLQIFTQTNVLEAKQFFDLKQVLKAIKFDVVLPELEANRDKAIKQSEKQFLCALKDVKYLRDATIDYILFNPPVDDIKPFLTDKVTAHQLDVLELYKLIDNFVVKRHNELINKNFEHNDVNFTAKVEDFYSYSITDNRIGEDVENFIRSKMIEKVEVLNNDETLMEDRLTQVKEIDLLLKRLKVNKIEKMMQKLLILQTNQAQAKEVVDKCKAIIDSSTIAGKSSIFLVMDNLYYRLCQKCDALIQKIKLKLQMVDKEKMFALLTTIESEQATATSEKSSSLKGIASDLYDDDEPDEIHISEDEDVDAEDEVVIDE